MKFQLSNPFNPPPAPPAFGSGKILPEKSSPLVSNSFLFSIHARVDSNIQQTLSLGFFQGLSSIGFHLFLRLGSPDPSNQRVCPSQIQICQPFDTLKTIPADLWELPQPQLTSSITDEIEQNFYSRCPPEKRPRFMNKEMQNVSPTISKALLSKNTAGDSEDDKREYSRGMEKVCRGL